MYDDGIDDVEFPTPICPITEPHTKHRIPGTWRDECPGVEAGAAEGDAPQRQPERNKCVHGFWIQGGIETCPDGCTKTLADETEQWIAEQVGQLSEGELLMLKGVLDDIAAGRPVEHFEAGTKVYANTWGTTEFIVQGTAPWHENGVVSRKVEIRSASGNLTGHVAPSELCRVAC